jgi:hypothetical protein
MAVGQPADLASPGQCVQGGPGKRVRHAAAESPPLLRRRSANTIGDKGAFALAAAAEGGAPLRLLGLACNEVGRGPRYPATPLPRTAVGQTLPPVAIPRTPPAAAPPPCCPHSGPSYTRGGGRSAMAARPPRPQVGTLAERALAAALASPSNALASLGKVRAARSSDAVQQRWLQQAIRCSDCSSNEVQRWQQAMRWSECGSNEVQRMRRGGAVLTMGAAPSPARTSSACPTSPRPVRPAVAGATDRVACACVYSGVPSVAYKASCADGTCARRRSRRRRREPATADHP